MVFFLRPGFCSCTALVGNKARRSGLECGEMWKGGGGVAGYIDRARVVVTMVLCHAMLTESTSFSTHRRWWFVSKEQAALVNRCNTGRWNRNTSAKRSTSQRSRVGCCSETLLGRATSRGGPGVALKKDLVLVPSWIYLHTPFTLSCSFLLMLQLLALFSSINIV